MGLDTDRNAWDWGDAALLRTGVRVDVAITQVANTDGKLGPFLNHLLNQRHKDAVVFSTEKQESYITS